MISLNIINPKCHPLSSPHKSSLSCNITQVHQNNAKRQTKAAPLELHFRFRHAQETKLASPGGVCSGILLLPPHLWFLSHPSSSSIFSSLRLWLFNNFIVWRHICYLLFKLEYERLGDILFLPVVTGFILFFFKKNTMFVQNGWKLITYKDENSKYLDHMKPLWC